MRYFYASITTRYDGFEWIERGVTRAVNEQHVQEKFDKFDWTHDNGFEEQGPASVEEISKEHYDVLSQYLVVI